MRNQLEGNPTSSWEKSPTDATEAIATPVGGNLKETLMKRMAQAGTMVGGDSMGGGMVGGGIMGGGGMVGGQGIFAGDHPRNDDGVDRRTEWWDDFGGGNHDLPGATGIRPEPNIPMFEHGPGGTRQVGGGVKPAIEDLWSMMGQQVGGAGAAKMPNMTDSDFKEHPIEGDSWKKLMPSSGMPSGLGPVLAQLFGKSKY